MERISVTSSNIKSVGYDNAKKILEIEFCNNRVYQYFDVPENIFIALRDADSVGGYLAGNIKGKYSYTALSYDPFSESDFIAYLCKLLKANKNYSNVLQEPNLVDLHNISLRPDITCEYKNTTLVIEVKNIISLTEKRVNQYIEQVKRYKSIEKNIQLVISFPSELQKSYEDLFIKEGIWVWDISTLSSLFSEQLQVIRETPLYPLIFSILTKKPKMSKSRLFIEKLNLIKAGKSDWSAYQKLIYDIMEHLFTPPLGKPLYEKSNETKINRRDIIIPNYSENGFWRLLREDHFAYYIVIDAKNLKGQVGKEEVLQISNYLNKFGTGLFAIIVSRKEPKRNAIQTQREHWIIHNKLIVFLEDKDIIQMLTMKDALERPEEVIKQKIEDFRLSF